MCQLDDDHQFNLLDSRGSSKGTKAVRLPNALKYMEDLSEDAVAVSPGENKSALACPLDESDGLQEPIVHLSRNGAPHLLLHSVCKGSRMLYRLWFSLAGEFHLSLSAIPVLIRVTFQ